MNGMKKTLCVLLAAASAALFAACGPATKSADGEATAETRYSLETRESNAVASDSADGDVAEELAEKNRQREEASAPPAAKDTVEAFMRALGSLRYDRPESFEARYSYVTPSLKDALADKYAAADEKIVANGAALSVESVQVEEMAPIMTPEGERNYVFRGALQMKVSLDGFLPITRSRQIEQTLYVKEVDGRWFICRIDIGGETYA